VRQILLEELYGNLAENLGPDDDDDEFYSLLGAMGDS